MTCLICRYFQPSEPPEHKQDREAGQCQSSCGDRWNQHTAINYVKDHGSLNGWCRLHPETKPVTYNHFCGDISVREHFFNHHWCVEPFKPEDNLFEWAQRTLGLVLHGTWREQRNEHDAEQNKQLRRQLKRAREISASRLKRLQKQNESKPESESERPDVPSYPRLVAG
jgi:hypothetical protein